MANDDMKTPLEDLLSHMKARASNTYCQYIDMMSRDECLGWEAKVKCGEFKKVELDAHSAAAQMLGKHRAFSDAVEMLRDLLEAANK